LLDALNEQVIPLLWAIDITMKITLAFSIAWASPQAIENARHQVWLWPPQNFR
jgi:hypothetical protein